MEQKRLALTTKLKARKAACRIMKKRLKRQTVILIKRKQAVLKSYNNIYKIDSEILKQAYRNLYLDVSAYTSVTPLLLGRLQHHLTIFRHFSSRHMINDTKKALEHYIEAAEYASALCAQQDRWRDRRDRVKKELE